MIRNFLLVLVAMLAVTSCNASTSDQTKRKARKPVAAATAATPTISDTTLMVTKDIPDGSAKVLVRTTAGDFTVLLYGDTPRHRDNFLKLARNGEFDGMLFHRVIKDFMVQAGDPDSKTADKDTRLGSNSIGDQIPAEIVYPRHFHKRGALAAARTGDFANPERKSSGSQFYVVTGRVTDSAMLTQMEAKLRQGVGQEHFNTLAREHADDIRRMQTEGDQAGLAALQEQLSAQTQAWLKENPVAFTPEIVETYTTIGGTPHLDNAYTVFGEVISGMGTIDKIQKAATNSSDRPIEDIRIISTEVIE